MSPPGRERTGGAIPPVRQKSLDTTTYTDIVTDSIENVNVTATPPR